MELRETTIHQAFAEKVAQKAVIIFVVITITILLIIALRKIGVFDPVKLKGFIESTGAYGPLVLIGIILVGSISLTIPATPAIILAGILYGPLLGGLYAYIGILLAASVAFFISRYFRDHITKFIGTHAEVLVKFQEKYVAYVIFFMRAIPFFHFELVSYAAGLTSVRYWAYILATGLGVLIPTTLFTTTGSAILEGNGILPIVSVVFMILLVFIVPIAIDHYNPWGWKEKLLHPKHQKKNL